RSAACCRGCSCGGERPESAPTSVAREDCAAALPRAAGGVERGAQPVAGDDRGRRLSGGMRGLSRRASFSPLTVFGITLKEAYFNRKTAGCGPAMRENLCNLD